MNSYNCTGNLGRDPELRSMPNGDPVCNFPLAVNLGKDVPPLWLKVEVFGNQADNCSKYLTKGSKVAVSGSLRLDEYEGRNGEQRQILVVRASQVTFVRSEPPESPQAPSPDQSRRDQPYNTQSTQQPTQQGGANDDLPF